MTLPEGEDRQRRIQKLLESREERLAEVKVEQNKTKKAYSSLWPTFSLTDIYAKCLCWLKNKPIKEESILAGIAETLNHISQGGIETEDIPPLVEIGKKIWTVPSMDIRHVVIDEAQDFSPYMIQLISEYIGHQSFTLVGDILQGIHGAQGIEKWETFQHENFGGKGEIAKLRTSYRSTQEIMALAQRILFTSGLSQKDEVKAVARHGEKPKILAVSSEKEKLMKSIALVKEWQEKGYQNIALITLTKNKGEQLYKIIGKQIAAQMLDETQNQYTGGLCIVSVAMAKGLEFDGVIVIDGDGENYPLHPFYGKLLYVACTRPLHGLAIVHEKPLSPLFF